MITKEQLLAELSYLNISNFSVDKELAREKRSQLQYQKLLELGLKRAAEAVADKSLALKIGEKLIGVADLKRKYEAAFKKLLPIECEMAKMRYFDGEPYKSIGFQIGYSESSVKHIFTGRKDRGEIGIIDKLLHIINKGEG